LRMPMHGSLKHTWRPSPPPVCRDDCSICQGTGWELVSEPGVSLARPCSCRTLDRMVRMRNRVRIPPRYEHCTLDNYTPLNFSQTRALAEARRFIARYPAPGRDLFFAGGPGVGKTHLAIAAIRELMPRLAEDALFVDFPDLLRPAELALGGGSFGLEGWDRLALCPVLVLDNFGVAAPARDGVAQVMRLLRGRWRMRRPTIYTGERIKLSLLTSGRSGDSGSSTQTFLLALPPAFLLTFLAQVKFLSVVGEDYRRKDSRIPELF
jgi:DNA replication protein DnaC